jgi:5-methylcytosine-specific restriction endonuclease McrA
MSSKKDETEINRVNQVVAAARQDRKRLEKSYRERALKMFPWICARCGREFTGKKLRELTVHHKDHNHENNPPDGSNWELLCVYCHDNEHSRYLDEQWNTMVKNGSGENSPIRYRPFADLETLLKKKK